MYRAIPTCALAGIAGVLLALGGCTTVVRHEPLAPTVAVTPTLLVHPTFRTQDTYRPTFTIRYFNDSAVAVDFGPGQVKAFFRNAPVPIYSHAERSAELREGAWQREIAHAILGTVAAVAVLYGLSHGGHQLAIVSPHSGGADHRSSGYRSHGHAPLGGLLVGAAVVTVAASGVEQLEHDAESVALVAGAILRPRRVPPRSTVTGQVVLKGCCDARLRADDVVRIEVTLSGSTSAFEFGRTRVGEPPAALLLP